MRPQHAPTPRPVMLGELTGGLAAVQKLNCAEVPIAGVTDDSRRVEPGALFVAVRGERLDGHLYIADAVRRGAAAVVCERLPDPVPPCPVIQVPNARVALSALAAEFHGRPAERLCVVGVTGTDGKTTTTELLRAILCEAGHPCGSLGTVSYHIGAREVESTQTSPHPLALHAMLREMVDAGLTHAAIEVSSHALVHHRTDHVPFRVAVLTNVTEDHLDFHGSLEAYVRAKQMLFERLGQEGVAVLNAESPYCERYAEAARPACVLTYGIKATADVKLERSEQSARGTTMLVRTPLGSYALRTRLLGEYNCENILAAATAAFALGVPHQAVQAALRKFRGVPGRVERVEVDDATGLPTLCVDYAHTPNALARVLRALRPFTRGRLICVFGCGGEREHQKRPVMGRIATSLADLTVITSDNSRGERTEEIIAQILAGIQSPHGPYIVEPDRRRAIERAVEAAGPEDIIALCGKGCEPFDDRIVAREVLLSRANRRRRSA